MAVKLCAHAHRHTHTFKAFTIQHSHSPELLSAHIKPVDIKVKFI